MAVLQTGCEVEKRIFTLSGVKVRIASVRSAGKKGLSRWRKRKAAERDE